MQTSLNYWQLVSYSDHIHQTLVGAQIQDTWTDGQFLVLEFYKNQSMYLLFFLKAGQPCVVLSDKRPPVKKVKKPVALFLQSHFVGHSLEKVFVIETEGRVLNLQFRKTNSNLSIKVILIPRSPNLIAVHDKNQVSLNKPVPLQTNQIPSQEYVKIDWLKYAEEFYLDHFEGSKGQSNLAKESNFIKNIEKKQQALKQLENQNLDEKIEELKALGEALKIGEAPNELIKYYNDKLSRQQNMEIVFKKAKDLKGKKLGLQTRINFLKNDIADLQKRLDSKDFSESQVTKSKSLLAASGGQGRTLYLDQDTRVEFGKSAVDNLKLLRQASAWHLWLHVKDYPGCHGIISFQKNRNITDLEITKACQWLIEESLFKKKMPASYSLQFVVVECRFVRPIKGDKLGRVTFKNEKVFKISSASKV